VLRAAASASAALPACLLGRERGSEKEKREGNEEKREKDHKPEKQKK